MGKMGKKPSEKKDFSAVNDVIEWNETFTGYCAVKWEKMPDIELYMDQVVTFLDRQMTMYRRKEDEKVITPSMINNYTKDHLIPRAKSKKYSKDHIALIMVVCSLKKVLSMPDLSNMLKDFKVNEDTKIEEFYELFSEYQTRAIQKTSQIISDSLKNTDIAGNAEKDVLKNLALKLSVEAQTKCAAAEQILGILEKNISGNQ